MSQKLFAIGLGGMVSLLALGAIPILPAMAKSAFPRQCVDISNLSSRQVVDKDTLFVRDTSGNAALLTLEAPCNHMDELDRIGFEVEGSSQICGPHDVKITYSRPMDIIGLKGLIGEVKPLSREDAHQIEYGRPEDAPRHKSN